MMRKITLPLGLMFIGLTGCATVVTPVVNSVSLKDMDLNQVTKMKKGEDCVSRYFIFGPFGDMSVVSAAKKAGISKVAYVDYRIDFGFFVGSQCVIVYGS